MVKTAAFVLGASRHNSANAVRSRGPPGSGGPVILSSPPNLLLFLCDGIFMSRLDPSSRFAGIYLKESVLEQPTGAFFMCPGRNVMAKGRMCQLPASLCTPEPKVSGKHL